MIYKDPIKTLKFSVPEPIEVVRSKISATTAKYRPLLLRPFSTKNYLFYGNIGEGSFRITRIIHFGNPHHPVAEVTLEPNSQGTTVTVDLCPTFLGPLFDFMWYGLWTFFVVIIGVLNSVSASDQR
jgi:hypothetical protein